MLPRTAHPPSHSTAYRADAAAAAAAAAAAEPVNRFKGNTGAVRRGSANRKPEPKIVRFRCSLAWIKNRPFSKLLGMDQKSTVFEVAWHGSKIDRFRGSLAWIKNRPSSGFWYLRRLLKEKKGPVFLLLEE